MEICEPSGLLIPMVPRLHQSNGYIKRKLWVWRAQKSIALVGTETLLTSAGPQTTPFHGGQYRVRNGNMRNIGSTYRHVATFPQEEYFIWKGSYGYGEPKMYRSSPWKNSTSLYRLPCFVGGRIDPTMEICESLGLPISMVTRLHQSNGYMKRKLRVWTAQKCIDLVGAETVLTSAGQQTTHFMGGSMGLRMEIRKISGLPIPMVPHLHQNNG